MPALITHYLCGNKMLEFVDDKHTSSFIENCRNAFNLGTQGPDILFYYGAWPWTKSMGIPESGERLHNEKTGAFMKEALMYAKAADKASKGTLTAYLCGYVCHYILDCHTHPYIFYKTGFVREGESYTPKYTCYHRRFESELDVLMLERELGKTPPRFNASQQIRIPAQAIAAIGKMYSDLFARVYGENLAEVTVCRAVNDIADIASALKDSTGFKKLLVEKAEKLLNKPPLFSSMILPLKINKGKDILNLQHSTWHLPWDQASSLTDSFPEMFEAAAREASSLCVEIIRYIYADIGIEKVLGLIGNRSFLTGMDCALDTAFVIYDCIYE